MSDILYEDNHLLVVVKKANVPVQKDESNDLDLLTILKKYIKDKYNKPGNVYLGLVHRLDRPVSGIMVFAKTSKSGLEDKLLKDHKNNITRVSKKGKEAILNYEVVKYKNNLSLVKIYLKTGRSHQIRVQFSSRNHPLVGDKKYGNDKSNYDIALMATYLSFYHPITKKKMEFEIPIPDKKPWNLVN